MITGPVGPVVFSLLARSCFGGFLRITVSVESCYHKYQSPFFLQTSVNPLTLTSVGHLFDERDQLKELFSKKNQVFLLSDVTLSQGLGDAGGYVTSFEAVFVKANPMSFLVWREKGKNNFVLVGRKDYTPSADDLYKKKMVRLIQNPILTLMLLVANLTKTK